MVSSPGCWIWDAAICTRCRSQHVTTRRWLWYLECRLFIKRHVIVQDECLSINVAIEIILLFLKLQNKYCDLLISNSYACLNKEL